MKFELFCDKIIISKKYDIITSNVCDCWFLWFPEPNPSCLGYDSQCVYCGVQSFGPCVK